jgi:hypothetical protein
MSVVNVKVANIRPQYNNLEEWMKNPNHVYVGRAGVVFIRGERFPKQASIWANPYKVGKEYTREEAITLYELYLREKIISHQLKDELLQLQGKVLGCWCHPEPCHAHVLLKLIEEFS